jgi:hypothetical protein
VVDGVSEADLRRIVDEHALRDLVNRYFYGMDRRDADVLRSIYLPDGVPGPDGDLVDLDTHVKGLLRIGRFASTHCVMGSHRFTIDGDTATGDTYAVNFCAIAPEDDDSGEGTDGRIHVRGVQYVDEFRRTADGWRIAKRTGPVALWQYELAGNPPYVPDFVLGTS